MKRINLSSKNTQMSEALVTMIFLTLSGGLQDAYSYCLRGKVFANAQTGNIVLMSQHFFMREWDSGFRYLIPVLSFAAGVFAAERIGAKFKTSRTIHWRQLILLLEIMILFLVGFLPGTMDIPANALASFACAMQVQAFRKVNGYAFASTMCIGNMRSGVESLSVFLRTGCKEDRKRACHYFGMILTFAAGAGIGGVLAEAAGRRLIWLSCILLTVGFLLMFLQTERTLKE